MALEGHPAEIASLSFYTCAFKMKFMSVIAKRLLLVLVVLLLSLCVKLFNLLISPETTLCGLRGFKNRPALFPGQMSYKPTKPGLVLF